MKTFEEALGVVTYHAKRKPSKDEEAAIISRLEDAGAKYQSIVPDIEDSDQFRACLDACLDIAEEEGVRGALLQMFMIGLTTGIEMEKGC